MQQKSQTVRFKSGAEMLETFGMQKGGKEYKRLVSGFERIFGATLFFGTDSMAGRAKMVQRTRFNFLQEAQSGTTAIWISILCLISSRT